MAEEEYNKGRAIWDMTQTEGWSILEQEIKDEMKFERNELTTLDLKDKSDSQIVAEYLQHRANIRAYQKILNKVESLLQQRSKQ